MEQDAEGVGRTSIVAFIRKQQLIIAEETCYTGEMKVPNRPHLAL